ncbi:MAG: biotin--[acetyl-CoA-carboxylase] ligase [Proteobacteria bacterium]|nr:biotin--[acetyl-CoA-carboxylase] ligase [Pseudomonadota bacterium]MBU1742930.1 biotin--[acetyl-CoA-carboxylase] ligase [Pseudomonadota bacterium]
MKRTDKTVLILKTLQRADGFVSGSELAAGLGVSRTAVWKLLENLRAQGVIIESRPGLGYHFRRAADRVSAPRILAGLNTTWLGHEVFSHQVVDSTNQRAKDLAAGGDGGHGALVVAERQTAGRGRLDRPWKAPSGRALLFSLLLRPRLAPRAVFGLTMASSVCLARVIQETTGVAAMVKWPNDVYAEGKKLAGILTEFSAFPDVIDYAVVGIGLNVNQTENDLSRLDRPATSLRQLCGRRLDRVRFLGEYLSRLEGALEAVEQGDLTHLKAEYDRLSLVLGRTVTVTGVMAPVTGRAVATAADGSLILDAKGEEIRVNCGDVSLRLDSDTN